MFELVMANPLWFLIAFVIGIATGWWIWAGRKSDESSVIAAVGGVGAGVAGAASGAAGMAKDTASAAGDMVKGAADTATGAAGSVVDTAKDAIGVEEPAPPPPPPPAPPPLAPVAAVQTEEGKPKIAAAVGEPDDLTRIKGVGPKLNDLCLSLGVKRFDQISEWSAADVAEVDQYLKIKGRIDRDEWVAQAKLLAAGKDEEHAKLYALKPKPKSAK